MFKYIIDDKTELRLLDIHHAEEVFKLVDSNREHLREYMPWVDSTNTIEDSRSFIQNCKEKHAANAGFDTGIWYEGQLAGIIGFHSMEASINSISIGYWLGEKFVGKGIVTKSSRVLIDYAFTILKFNRIEITCEENNRKSKAIPERLGFKKEGITRDGEILYGRYVNSLVYSLLRGEWLEQKNVEKICPLCGEDNNCKSRSGDCWCNTVIIPDYVLEMLPEDKRGKACICESCVEKYR